MTKVQLRRWKKLASGFAQQLDATERRKKKLLADIDNFFDCRVNCDYKNILDWDGNKGTVYVCDEVDDFFNEYRHYHYKTDEDRANKYYHQLSACIRAGFDLAVEQSAGVVGWFTKQNITDIFKGRVPNWITSDWKMDWKDIPADAELLL